MTPDASPQRSAGRRFLLCVPLLACAPLTNVVAPYLDGAGFLPRGSGLIAGIGSVLILPWIVSAVFVVAVKASAAIRVAIFIVTLIVQPVLAIALPPGGARMEMMGLAWRLRREFSADALKDCAMQLRQKHRAGTLAVHPLDEKDGYWYVAGPTGVVVAEAELPATLRGRFQRVFIVPGSNGENERVVFALDWDRAIICDNRSRVYDPWTYSIGDGVHAFRYERP